MKNKIYKVGGLFSGVGGIELGFSIRNKFEIVWASDFDKYSAKTYKINHNHKFIEKDINDIVYEDIDEVDVLVGGFPCQAFSVAGYQKGFGDERGNVFFKIIDVINLLKEKPKVLLLENVKNIYTHDKKNTFKRITEILEANNYIVSSKIMNTSEYSNIPQNRERTYILCFLRKGLTTLGEKEILNANSDLLFPTKSISDIKVISHFLEKNEVDEKYYYRQDKYNYKELSQKIIKLETFYQWRRVYVRENKSGVCPTLTANMGTGGHNVPLIKDAFGIRKLTPRECFNLQGFPRSFKLPSTVPNTQLYKQAGNSVTVAVIKRVANKIYKCLDKYYK